MSNNENKYTVRYFKENLPEWKRKKDPITSRFFYRPVSFVVASVAAKLGINANDVSYFSVLIAIVACVFFIIPNYIINVVGAILINIWLILDCTDGNLARSVKKQPYGDFADSISSYILVGVLGTALGLTTYFSGGLIVEKKCIWIVLLGAIASSSDTLMRLIYQKYKSSERALADAGRLTVENDKRTDNSQSNSLLVRIESDFGIGGILPILVLLGVIFKVTDLIVLYCFAYYFLSCLVMSFKYISKAINKTNELERNEK